MANEFREAAEQMWRLAKGFSTGVYMCSEDREGVDLVARAMELAACESGNEVVGEIGHWVPEFYARVAARVKGRIESE